MKMSWKTLHKIAVSGSRSFKYPDLATQWIDGYIRKKRWQLDDVVIITGGAIGIDAAVEIYCLRRGIKNLITHARWIELDTAAGPIRNKHIVQLSDEVIAFWDGKSKGTGGTIKYAQKIKKPIHIFRELQLVRVLKAEIPVIKIPRTASNRDAHNLRELAAAADMKELKEEGRLYDRKRNLRKVLHQEELDI